MLTEFFSLFHPYDFECHISGTALRCLAEIQLKSNKFKWEDGVVNSFLRFKCSCFEFFYNYNAGKNGSFFKPIITIMQLLFILQWDYS